MTPQTLSRIIGGDRDIDPTDRIIMTLDELQFVVSIARQFSVRIGLTSGSFDMPHVGHTRYMRRGWQRISRGDGKSVNLMFVAVESDEKIQSRKGLNRPVIPFVERTEFIASTRWADVIIAKEASYPHWAITKIVKPDVLLAVEGTYKEEEIFELQKICGEVYVAPRQAENSTSNQVRRLQLEGASEMSIHGRQTVFRSISQKLASLIKDGKLRLSKGVKLEDVLASIVASANRGFDKAHKVIEK